MDRRELGVSGFATEVKENERLTGFGSSWEACCEVEASLGEGYGAELEDLAAPVGRMKETRFSWVMMNRFWVLSCCPEIGGNGSTENGRV